MFWLALLWVYVAAYTVCTYTDLLYREALEDYTRGLLPWRRLVFVVGWRTALAPAIFGTLLGRRFYKLGTVLRHLREPDQLFLRSVTEAGYQRDDACEMLAVRNALAREYGRR